MEIRIERTTEKILFLRRKAWAKLERRYWVFTMIFFILGTFIAFSKSSINGRPFEIWIPTIIFGSAVIGYGVAYVKMIFDSRAMLFKDLKFKMLTNQNDIYTLILNDKKIISDAPNLKQEFDWDYFSRYDFDEAYIYLIDQTNFLFPTIVIDKNEITIDEFNQVISFLQKQKKLLKKQ